MRRAIPATLAACALAAAAAWGAETPEERGKRVVNEALQALGGDAFLNMQDRVESGRAYSFYGTQISGRDWAKVYTRYLEPLPGKVEQREREAFGQKEDSAVIFTETGGWQVNFHGALPMEKDTYDKYLFSTLHNILYMMRMRLKEPGMAFYWTGSDRFLNLPVEIVDITDASNFTVTVSFDQHTKLPVRQSLRQRNEQYKDFDTEVTLFSLWRNVGGGVMWPCNIRRERNGERIYEMFADTVQINQDLSDSLFSLPADVKMLKKK